MPRDTFKQDLQSACFNPGLTIFEPNCESALGRVRAVLDTGTDPGSPPLNGGNNEPEAEDCQADFEDIANHRIISLIKSEFKGHNIAYLVAEIMSVEGYTTQVLPPSPDAVNILAAGGTLGLGEDRIYMQVKSGDGAADRDVVLRLLDLMQAMEAQKGLLVSIGGVNAAARKELNKEFFRLRLWQMSDLLKALFRAYGELSTETRAKLPLKQVWVPVPEEMP